MEYNTLHVDSQLMRHMLAANPINNHHHLNAVRDERNQPLIFSIGNDGHLWVIKADESGGFKSIDISSTVSARGAVSAFAVAQAPDAAANIFLAFSVTRPESKFSDLHVLDAFPPSDLNNAASTLPSKVIDGIQNEEVKVKGLHMSLPTKSTDSWPFVVASYNFVLDLNNDANIARIVVSSSKWEWYKDLRIPEQAHSLIAVCGAQLNSTKKGVLCLYKKSSEQSLIFSTIEVGDPSPYYLTVKVPSGANITSMAPYKDQSGNTNFWLVGDGLWHLARSDMIAAQPWETPSRTINRISEHPLFAGSTNLTVEQAGNALSIWFSNKDHTIGYQRARNNGTLTGDVTPLLPCGKPVDYTALLDPITKSQSFIIVDEKNTLSLMEQAKETDMWNTREIVVTKPNALVEVQAFVSHLELRDASTGGRLVNTKLQLATTGWVSLLINGEERMVGTTPIVVSTDNKGIITLVQPTDDISGYKYIFANDDVAVIAPEGFTVDPSQKAQDGLFTLTSVDALRKVRASGSDEELQAAADAIKKLHGVSSDMKTQDQVPVDATTLDASAVNAVVGLRLQASASDLFIDKLWGAWEWVKRKWDEVTTWVVDKVNGAWKFIVHIAGEVWHFVLDSAAAVVKAAIWVLEKVKAGIKAVIQFVEFIFDWPATQKTAEGIKKLVNAFLDYGINAIDSKTPFVNEWVDGLEKKLGDALGLKLPDGLGDKKLTPADAGTEKTKQKEISTVESNTGNYHLNEGLKTSNKSTGKAVIDVFANLYDDVLKPAFEMAEQGAKELSERVMKLFMEQKSMSPNEVLSILGGEVVHLLIQTIKALIQGVMRIGKVLLKSVQDIINSSIDVFGIFGGLFKTLGINLPSWLDVLCIICAIPVRFFSNLITGEGPKRIYNFDPKSMLEEGKLDKDSALAYNDLAGYLEITYAVSSTIYKAFKIESSEIPQELEVFSILSFGGDLVLLAATFPYDKASPGWDYRVAVWGIGAFNSFLKAILQMAKVPYSLKLLAAADVIFALTSFGLVQAVHYFQITEEYEGENDSVTGLDITNSVFDVVERLGTSVGVLAPEPITKLVSMTLIGITGTGKAALSTGKAGIASAGGSVNYVQPITL